MSKGFIGFICGLVAGVALVFAYLHKAAIFACVMGDELPDAPDCCPAAKAESDDVEAIEKELDP